MRPRKWSRPIGVMLLLGQIAGCYHYAAPADMGPQAYITEKKPKQIRVTLTDSSQTVLYEPWITDDSLGGRTGRSSTQAWAVPRERVVRIEAQRLKVAATVLAVGIPVILFGGIIVLATACSDGCAGLGSY